MRLTPKVHDRDVAGLTYVYPVVSRRARGVSVGINLNPNNACNWRCAYCQVPNLEFGKGPAIDLELLEHELDEMLDALVNGDYMERHVPETSRRLNDIAFSGNGEPTSSPDFEAAVEVVVRVLERFDSAQSIATILITNGSLIHKREVQAGLARLAQLANRRGQVWFKLDSATDAGQAKLNAAHTGVERARKNLITSARIVPTWIQTMVLAWDGEHPSEAEQSAYLAFLKDVLADGAELCGVHLYGLARKSYQPEAEHLSALPRAWMEAYADRIRALGLEVRLAL